MSKSNYYWNKKQEDLCWRWYSASTETEFARIYNELVPALNLMAENIINKYFTVNASIQKDLRRDCVQAAFLALKKFRADKTKTSGFYSYCSMVIKNYANTVLVLPGKKINKITGHKMVYVDVYADEMKPLELESIDFNYNILLDYINNKRVEIQNEINRMKIKIKSVEKLPFTVIGRNHKLEILDLCEEFIRKYNCFISSTVIDYILLNKCRCGKLSRESIIVYFKNIFNQDFSFDTDRGNSGGIVDNRYHYLQDDVEPNKNIYSFRNKRKEIFKKLPELETYQYF